MELFVLAVFCTFFAVAGPARADWNIWDAGVFLRVNGGDLDYHNATNFNHAFLGDFYSISNNSLILVGGEAKTWKNVPPGDVTGAKMHYAIHPIDAAPGTFTEVPLPHFSDDGGNNNQTWQNITHSNNVLSSLTRPGTYRIAVYFSATGANPSERYYSNLEANFVATFNYNIPELTVNGINADYTVSNYFINEAEEETDLVEIVFRPKAFGPIDRVEVFSNLNRRDWATAVWTNAHGVVTHEGIQPRPGNSIEPAHTNFYHRAYPMDTVTPDEEYSLTLPVEKTGMYRLSARYKVQGNTNWFWYTDVGMGRRDHAIVVSPSTARDIVMYEVNTLIIKSQGTLHEQRSTFVDLWDGPGSDPTKPPWNLEYLQDLGVNCLWFQPIHPYGIDGRHQSAADINARDPGAGADTWIWNGGAYYTDVDFHYELGSPYAVKNFWEIEPRMSKANTREAGMQEFIDFVEAASEAGIGIMLDAAFNHTAWDVELGDLGVELFAPEASPTDEIRDTEARFFSRDGSYHNRAEGAHNIAPAPDRFDFGKWLDAADVYFGRYASLWNTDADAGAQKSEGDWFDYTEETGHFDQISQNVWKYFGAYVPYWLEKTGYTADTPKDQIHVGIDGLRCDFGQGLPPQAWEYIINRARAVKWNFVFMAESLDGGEVTYRSSRHFDILNENIVFAQKKSAPDTLTTGDVRNLLEDRRQWYGLGLVLLNTASHDEDNYEDPWHALIRYAALSTADGAPMIFPGQELGISTQYGYDLMERNMHKWIPHFKTYNSMMPIWNNTDFGLSQLFPVYAGIGRARNASPALRSPNRWFLNPIHETDPHPNIHAIAKYETANASPAVSDVVLGFVNLQRNSSQSGTFGIPEQLGTLLGIQSGRHYNVRNIAAHTGLVAGRDEWWLWGSDRTGQDVVDHGVYAELHGVPGNDYDWYDYPYEAQYLKLYDVTAPSSPPTGTPQFSYTSGNSYADFTWNPVADAEGMNLLYLVELDINGTLHTNQASSTNLTVFAAHNDQIRIRVAAANPHKPENASAYGNYSDWVTIHNPSGGETHDSPVPVPYWWLAGHYGEQTEQGYEDIALSQASNQVMNVWQMYVANLDPTQKDAIFTSQVEEQAEGNVISWHGAEGRNYKIYWSTNLISGFEDFGVAIPGPQSTFTDTVHNAKSPIMYRVGVTLAD